MNIPTRIIYLTALTLALSLQSAFALDPSTNTPGNAEPDENYLIGPGDILDISVWKEDELVKQVVVPPDGIIAFPLAGGVKAGGKTVTEISDDLKKRLGKIIVDPVVTVFLQSYESNKVYVIGKVNRPGEFHVSGRVDVMQALAMAGGMASFASKDSVKILRREREKLVAIPFDYDEVADGDELQQNIILKKGDVVVVQ